MDLVLASEKENSAKHLALAIFEELKEKKAREILVLDIAAKSGFADILVIATAASVRHAQALADALSGKNRDCLKNPFHVEGYAQGEWILLDMGDVVVNIFQENVRGTFNLEGLWNDAIILIDDRNIKIA